MCNFTIKMGFSWTKIHQIVWKCSKFAKSPKNRPKSPKITQNRLKSHQIRRWIWISLTLPISKLSKILKFHAQMAIWQLFEKWTVFFQCILKHNPCDSSVAPLILGKMASDRQFLTKIHKVGLVWSLTLVSIDKLTKKPKFQTFIVVRAKKYAPCRRIWQTQKFIAFCNVNLLKWISIKVCLR